MFGGGDETAVFHIPMDDVSFGDVTVKLRQHLENVQGKWIKKNLLFAVDCVFTTLQSFAPMEMQLSELIEAIQTSTGNKRQILNQFVDAQLNWTLRNVSN